MVMIQASSWFTAEFYLSAEIASPQGVAVEYVAWLNVCVKVSDSWQ